MNDRTSPEEQAASFQKIWGDTMLKIMQVASTTAPGTPPPEAFRNFRDGTLKALAESWNEYMRSPQFLDAMKQMMDQNIALRNMGNDLLGEMRHQMQAPSREDIDTVMLAVRHMEKRLLDRIEQLSAQLGATRNSGPSSPPRKRPPSKAAKSRSRAPVVAVKTEKSK